MIVNKQIAYVLEKTKQESLKKSSRKTNCSCFLKTLNLMCQNSNQLIEKYKSTIKKRAIVICEW